MNIVVLIGRLTATPELKTTKSGLLVTSFTIAVDRPYTKDKQTDFINCVAWRQNADFISKYFTKGQMIAIEGGLQQTSYEDKQGNKRTTYDVVVNKASFCGNREQAEPDVNYDDVDTSEFDEIDIANNDLPF